MAVEASHNKTKTHTNKLWSKNYEYGFNKFKLFVTLINKNNTFFFLKQFPRVVFSCIYLFVKSCLPSLVCIYLSRVVYLLLYLFICQKLSTFSCIYLFVKSCLPPLVFIYFSKVVYLLLYLFICQELSTFSWIYLFAKLSTFSCIFFICHELSTFSCIFKFYLFGSFY